MKKNIFSFLLLFACLTAGAQTAPIFTSTIITNVYNPSYEYTSGFDYMGSTLPDTGAFDGGLGDNNKIDSPFELDGPGRIQLEVSVNPYSEEVMCQLAADYDGKNFTVHWIKNEVYKPNANAPAIECSYKIYPAQNHLFLFVKPVP